MNLKTDSDGIENESENVKVAVSSKKHVCPYVGCSFAFDRPWKLNRHINIHTNQRPFKCDHTGCSKAYTNNSHLQRHKSVTHSESKPAPENIPCLFPGCNKIFANKWSMKRHYSGHYSIGPHKCVICGETFKKYNELKYHVYSHWGLDPFVCENCKESFKTRQELRRHERQHKVYYCDHEGCQDQFNSWNLLRSHSKLAHPDKYQCDFCQNYYKNKWTLTEHVLSHLPFDKRDIVLCPFPECERHYFYERNLESHIRSYHHKLNYKCDKENCGKTFTTKRRLNDHIKRHEQVTVRRKASVKLKNPRFERRPRKQRMPKKTKKSMASILSGVILPKEIDRNISKNNITPEVLEYIKKVKNYIFQETKSSEENDEMFEKEPLVDS